MRILITGASSGIGAALSRHYARPGVVLSLLSQSEPDLQNVSRGCQTQGAEVHIYCADVSDAAAMREVGRRVILEAGLPDLIIANAGIRLEDPDHYDRSTAPYDVMMVNYIGVINTFAPFLDPMKERRSGQLAAVSSIAALRATPNSGIYSASKAALNLWTEALRLKLTPYNISVTTASSGFVRTAMTAALPFYMPGILSADQAASIIARAIASRRSRILFPWQSFIMWGAFRAMPGALYDWVILSAMKWWPGRQSRS